MDPAFFRIPMAKASTASMAADRLVLGGRFGERADAKSFALLDAFVDAGGVAVETAASYANGEAERQIGRWLHRRSALRDWVRIVNKIGHGAPGERGHLNSVAIGTACDAALRRLGVERIDLLLLHRDEPGRSLQEIDDAMAALHQAGKIAEWGVSNWPMDRALALRAARAGAYGPGWASLHFALATADPACLWPGARAASVADIEKLRAAGFNFLAWSSQARGWFSDAADVKCDLLSAFDSPSNRRRRERAIVYGRERGLSASAVALAFVLSRQPGISAAIGPETLGELQDSLRGSGHVISPPMLDFLLG